MSRFACSLVLLSLALSACADDDGYRYRRPWSGEVDARACGHTRESALLSCATREFGADATFAVCGDMQSDNTVDIAGSLAVAGDWRVASPAHVDGAVLVQGALHATNTVDVRDALRASEVTGDHVDAGDADDDLPAPLDCGSAPDVAALVAENRPIAGRWSPDVLADVRAPTVVLLGCESYRFSELRIDNTLTLHVTGDVTISVEGDVRIAAPTRIELDAGATLSFLIAGSLTIDNTLSIAGGDSFLAVGGALRVASPFELEGRLFAPKSSLSLDNTFELTGSAYVGAARVASPLHVYAATAEAGRGCDSDRSAL